MQLRNLLIECRFCGQRYRGFQVQKTPDTVCHQLQDAIERVFPARHDIIGCSRTDSGVHADQFFFNFHTPSAIGCERVPAALNCCLPPDIAVVSCKEVANDFHARYNCIAKEYLYLIRNTPVRDPFLAGRALHVCGALDVRKMDQAARALIGTYDFSAFASAKCTVDDRVRTIQACAVRRAGENILITVRGDGFLTHMVRIMTGTLLMAARGQLAAQEIVPIILSKDRARAGFTAKADGLYLHRVFYPPFGENSAGEGNL